MPNSFRPGKKMREGELDVRILGSDLNKERLVSILNQFWIRNMVIDILVLTSEQLDIILTWELDPIDIEKPPNLDIGRLRVCVVNSQYAPN